MNVRPLLYTHSTQFIIYLFIHLCTYFFHVFTFSLFKKSLGPESINTLNAQENVALAFAKDGKFDKAHPYFKKSGTNIYIFTVLIYAYSLYKCL